MRLVYYYLLGVYKAPIALLYLEDDVLSDGMDLLQVFANLILVMRVNKI